MAWSPTVSIAFVLSALGALVGGVKGLQARGALSAELSRKLVHIGMGVVCLTFPWLFETTWPVWLLAGLAVGALALLRLVPAVRSRLGSVLHSVERRSLGEVYFPLGVAAVFTLARGNVLLFVIPVALLTFADAAGALVGKRWGRHRFETLEGSKSIEGSAAVGLVSALCVAGPLLAYGHPPATALVIALVMGLFGLILEAIAWRGLDNVFLPLAAFTQLAIYLALPLPPLVARLGVLVGLFILSVFWRRGSVIDHGARLGAALAFFFFWAVGGWPWLVAPTLLLASYVRLMPSIPGGPPRHNLLAVLCLGSAALPWATAHALVPSAYWLLPYTVGLAAQQGIIAAVRYQQAHPGWARSRCLLAGWLQAAVVQFALGGLLWWSKGIHAGAVLAALGATALGLLLFSSTERELRQPNDLNARWWKQGIAALSAAVLAAAMLFLHDLLPQTLNEFAFLLP